MIKKLGELKINKSDDYYDKIAHALEKVGFILVLELETSFEKHYIVAESEGSLDVAIKALEREPCEDAISRKKVIDTIYHECSGENLDIDFAKVLLLQRKINSLPSVKPEPKAAYWVEYKPDHHRCSKCGRDALVKWHNAKRDNIDILTNHCPNCGAKMIGRQRWESDEID